MQNGNMDGAHDVQTAGKVATMDSQTSGLPADAPGKHAVPSSPRAAAAAAEEPPAAAQQTTAPNKKNKKAKGKNGGAKAVENASKNIGSESDKKAVLVAPDGAAQPSAELVESTKPSLEENTEASADVDDGVASSEGEKQPPSLADSNGQPCASVTAPAEPAQPAQPVETSQPAPAAKTPEPAGPADNLEESSHTPVDKVEQEAAKAPVPTAKGDTVATTAAAEGDQIAHVDAQPPLKPAAGPQEAAKSAQQKAATEAPPADYNPSGDEVLQGSVSGRVSGLRSWLSNTAQTEAANQGATKPDLEKSGSMSSGKVSPLPRPSSSNSLTAPAAQPLPKPASLVSLAPSTHDKENTINASQLLKLGAFKLQPLKDFVPYEELIKLRLEDGIDPLNRQDYLSDEDFAKVFGMDREAFRKLPSWKQTRAKKQVNLF